MKEKLLVGNCLETLKEIPDNSIDSVVTDPPYELGFMGKSWDNTGIAFNVKVWQECMRVLKPGGHLIAFSGSRTYHRMAVAIEDAGFEIRDQIMWVYGSGFPKSHNVSKGIDKIEGVEPTIVGQRMAQGSARKIKGTNAAANKIPNSGSLEYDETIIYETVATSDAAKQWQGWGTALKPAHEPIVVARKPISEKTVAENVLTYGTGAINIDASRVGTQGGTSKVDVETKERIGNEQIYGVYNNVAFGVPVENLGRFPANLILSHNPDCQEDIQCTEGCPFFEFPNTSGGSYQKTSKKRKGFMLTGSEDNVQEANAPDNYGDKGSAARFFYCAKASKSERNAGLTNEAQIELDRKDTTKVGSDNPRNRSSNAKQNFHPTVKPLTLIRYLIKLTTKPGGTVLDPFLGSGTTAVAATLDGYNWVGCELTEEYLPIINGRVAYAKAEVAKAKKKKETTPTLFEEEVNKYE